ncbi:HNH endonuclease [Paenibacillus pabuli]|uniref:HNH endonuclease n=1 Tax=Paenibacillus pabuli TaxID=1472 RepID=UPI0007858A8C|nr:HNH endonuclease [Paenibacillus pabuli]MEC0127158.1 HNH endonuclease [Paenibacillus pabuli]
MIKITRTTPPHQLSPEIVKQLTEDYLSTKRNVWNVGYIKNALLDMSNSKCIFCECKLGEESKYIEVEHFHPKSLYPGEVMLWTNLLPICKRCNGLKRDHDTKLNPIINPTVDDPKNYLFIKDYRYRAIDDLGKRTIKVLQLNDSDRLVLPRFKIGDAIAAAIESLVKVKDKIDADTKIEDENELISKLRNLLVSCQPDSEYSTVCSYSLLTDDNYFEVKDYLVSEGLWDSDLERLETVSFKHSLIRDKEHSK